MRLHSVGYHAQAGQMVPEIGKAGADNRAITAPLWQGMRAFVQRSWQAGPLREVQIPPQTCIAAFLQMVQAPRMEEVRTLGEITVEDGGSWKPAAPASWGAYLHAPAQSETGPCPGALETCVFAAPVWRAAAIRQGVRCTET